MTKELRNKINDAVYIADKTKANSITLELPNHLGKELSNNVFFIAINGQSTASYKYSGYDIHIEIID